MSIRIIGIDLAVCAKHTAAIYDPATNTHLTKRFQFRSRAADIERLLSKARKNGPEDLEWVRPKPVKSDQAASFCSAVTG